MLSSLFGEPERSGKPDTHYALDVRHVFLGVHFSAQKLLVDIATPVSLARAGFTPLLVGCPAHAAADRNSCGRYTSPGKCPDSHPNAGNTNAGSAYLPGSNTIASATRIFRVT